MVGLLYQRLPQSGEIIGNVTLNPVVSLRLTMHRSMHSSGVMNPSLGTGDVEAIWAGLASKLGLGTREARYGTSRLALT